MKKTILISATALIIGIGIGIGAEHYFTHNPKPMVSGVIIYPEDDPEDDDRPTFSVVFDDEKVMDNMYAEEIAECLLSGKWRYNEDAHIPLVSLNPLKQ